MDERIKKQRLSRRDFSNFPSIISRVIREIKYVFRILKRTKKYSVFFTSNDPPDSRRIRSEFPLKFRGYIEIEVEWCPGYYANGAAETVTAKKRDGVGKQVSKDGFSWFPRKLRVKSCFAGIYSRERSKCLGGVRQSVRVTGSRFVCQLFHLVVSLLYRGPPLSYICRSGRNKRTDDYAPVKLIYAACLCTRAKPDCSNKRTTSDLTDIIYIYIPCLCACARAHHTTLITRVTPLYSFISFIFVRETMLTRVATIDL